MKCRTCKHNYKPRDCEPRCNLMCDGQSDYEAITNADKIRAMSDEELAKFMASGELAAICPVCSYYGTTDCYIEGDDYDVKEKNCDQGIIQWLHSEAEG